MENNIVKFKDGSFELDFQVTPEQDTVWLRAEEMAQLFDRDRSVIQRHIRSIFRENELDRSSTCANFAHI